MHKFKHEFGQNFLRQPRFARSMVELLDIQENDVVIEIGPGDGAVTKLLLDSPAQLVTAIDIDYSLIVNLVRKFGQNEKFELAYQDILKFNWQQDLTQFTHETNQQLIMDLLKNPERQPIPNLKIIGSLPFNISKEIIRKALIEWPLASKMVFILQLEVGEDYCAEPPEASFLSNWIQLYGKAKKHQRIAAQHFFPQPKVDSVIISITPHKQQLPVDKANKLTQTLRQGFNQPRKKLSNNLPSEILSKLPADWAQKRPAEVDLVRELQSINH